VKIFRKTPPNLATRLAAFDAAGFPLAEGVVEQDLLKLVNDPQQFQTKPGRRLAQVLGSCVDGDAARPICPRIFLFDLECVDGQGAYTFVLERCMELVADELQATAISELHADGAVHLKFELGERSVEWRYPIDAMWLDPKFLRQLAKLIAKSGTDRRLYWNQSDYEQKCLLVALAFEDWREFEKLSGVSLEPLGPVV